MRVAMEMMTWFQHEACSIVTRLQTENGSCGKPALKRALIEVTEQETNNGWATAVAGGIGATPTSIIRSGTVAPKRAKNSVWTSGGEKYGRFLTGSEKISPFKFLDGVPSTHEVQVQQPVHFHPFAGWLFP